VALGRPQVNRRARPGSRATPFPASPACRCG
jgi:hypothetical protein